MTKTNLETLRANLIQSIGAGIHEVRDSTGESIRYSSLKEMREAVKFIDSQIRQLKGTANPIRITINRGL